jgi:hypothetical protein
LVGYTWRNLLRSRIGHTVGELGWVSGREESGGRGEGEERGGGGERGEGRGVRRGEGREERRGERTEGLN